MANSFPTSSSGVTVESKPRSPRLDNPIQYRKIDKIPIIDTLERTFYKTNKAGKKVKVRESLDEKQLRVLCKNSHFRDKRGDHAILAVGHTDDEGKEADQPPFVGYASNFQMGQHNGRPAILADLYIDTEECDPDRLTKQFPRRSAEIVGLSSPGGFIDIVSVLKRTPERDLGLVAHATFSSHKNVSRFMCPDCAQEESKLADGDRKKKILKNALELIKQLAENIIDSPDAHDHNQLATESSESSDASVSSGEPEMAQTKDKKKSKFEHEEPSASEPSEATPSGPSEPSAKKRMDPSEPSDTSEPSEASEPSAPPKKSKMAAAGPPGPLTTGPAPVKASSSKEKTRMNRESENIQLSRFEKRLAALETENKTLRDEINSAKSEKRLAVIERQVAQLEFEGVDLVRADEVARLAKMPDEEIEPEVSRMRKHYTRTIVGQPMLEMPGLDLGGNTLEKPKKNPLAFDAEDEVEPGVFIRGAGSLSQFMKKPAATDELPSANDPRSLSRFIAMRNQSAFRKS
jgi:hypothetical protein